MNMVDHDIKFEIVGDNAPVVHLSLTHKKGDVYNVFQEESDTNLGDFDKSRLLGSFTEEQLAIVRKRGTTNFVREKKYFKRG
jgi:hypothetical protein